MSDIGSTSGLRRCGGDGRLKIDRAAADADVERAAMEFITPMSKGDGTTVNSLLRHYVVVTPEINAVVARRGATPALQRAVYSTADRLSPPAP